MFLAVPAVLRRVRDVRRRTQAMIQPVRHDSDRVPRVDTRVRRLLLRLPPVPRVRERIAVVYRASARSAHEDPHVDRTITVKDGVISVKNALG